MFTDSFAVRDDETVAATIKEFDRLRDELLAAVAATDPAGSTTAPPAPWHGIVDARPIHARYYLVHLVEECALARGARRHHPRTDRRGGGADAGAHPGRAGANAFFQPYEAAPGTLLA